MNFLSKASVTLALGACDRAGYLSPEVHLETTKGLVACQLYTVDRLYWDEATSYPDSMKKSEADAYCKAEGRKRKETAEAQPQT